MFKLVLDMTDAEINAVVEEEFKKAEAETLDQFKKVLAEALRIQRAKVQPVGYNDQTGQLRSSVGGIIYKDGRVLYEDFELAPYGTNKAPGLKEGKEKAFAVLRETSGWGITLVAGMEYASWVQGRHSKSVVEDAFSDVAKSLDQAFTKIDA